MKSAKIAGGTGRRCAGRSQQVMEAIDTLLDSLSQEPIAEGSLPWRLQNNLHDYKRVLLQETGEQEIEDKEQPTVWIL